VLIERVEGLASSAQWQRAYQEINDFEGHLIRHGTPVVKFWIHISETEQLRRFDAREADPRKQHKLTPDDWRNRARRAEYELAVDDMVAHTSTRDAPWLLVPGDDKRHARVTVIEEVCARLERCLEAYSGQREERCRRTGFTTRSVAPAWWPAQYC
jgi:polyphosphate kinase 2 (PPK2 family)